MTNWIVIGIAGITNSGKTSIANILQEKYPDSILLKQDDYFRSLQDPNHIWIPELKHINWDVITSLNIDKMIYDINKILQNNPSQKRFLILEGFLLFNDPRLYEICNYKFFIDLDYDTCKIRRTTRNYDPPDVPGYFEHTVWPQAVLARDEIKLNMKDVIFLNGTLPIDTLVDNVIQHIL